MSEPRLILIVRHGETEWSALGRHTGRTDIALTAAGRDEARAVGPFLDKLLGGDVPGQVVVSPRRRAGETAALAAQPGWPEPRVDERVAEYDYGDFEGFTAHEIRAAAPDWELFRDPIPGGESPEQVQARCDSFVSDLAAGSDGSAVVVFTHGHCSRALTARLVCQPISVAALLRNGTASVAALPLVGTPPRRVLSLWNGLAAGRSPQL